MAKANPSVQNVYAASLSIMVICTTGSCNNSCTSPFKQRFYFSTWTVHLPWSGARSRRQQRAGETLSAKSNGTKRRRSSRLVKQQVNKYSSCCLCLFRKKTFKEMGLRVHPHLRFITRLRFRFRLPLGLRMGCAPIFAIRIAIPIHSIENNCNCYRNRKLIRLINRRCEWTIKPFDGFIICITADYRVDKVFWIYITPVSPVIVSRTADSLPFENW